jgi:hypothetical protein
LGRHVSSLEQVGKGAAGRNQSDGRTAHESDDPPHWNVLRDDIAIETKVAALKFRAFQSFLVEDQLDLFLIVIPSSRNFRSCENRIGALRSLMREEPAPLLAGTGRED